MTWLPMPAKSCAPSGADMIVANDVTQEGAGFDVDTNIATLFLRDGRGDFAAAHDQN